MSHARLSGRVEPTAKEIRAMVTVLFPDRETGKRALAFLLGRFSGRVI
jgi:hypothetical protein